MKIANTKVMVALTSSLALLALATGCAPETSGDQAKDSATNQTKPSTEQVNEWITPFRKEIGNTSKHLLAHAGPTFSFGDSNGPNIEREHKVDTLRAGTKLLFNTACNGITGYTVFTLTGQGQDLAKSKVSCINGESSLYKMCP